MLLSAGDRVGRYVIEAFIGGGGMGQVYRAHDSQYARKVAIKIPKLAGLSDDDVQRYLTRFAREAATLATFRHRHIVEFLDVSSKLPTPYFSMELLDGAPAIEWAEKNGATAADWLTIAGQICGALAYAHSRGVVHRDIKSDNVLVSGTSGKLHTKIIDWGILHNAAATQITRTGDALGTLGAIDPAVLLGEATWSTSSDLYSLGALLVRGITGEHHLLVGRDASATDKGTANVLNAVREVEASEVYGSVALRDLLLALLDGSPNARPQSAEAVGVEVQRLRFALGTARRNVPRRAARTPAHELMLPRFEDALFRIGESPFKIKGSAYLGTFKQYEHFANGGLARVLASLPRELAQFARGGFHTSGWYDVFPMVYMDAVAARLAGKELLQFAKAACEFQADLDMRGIHKTALKFLSPRNAIDKVCRFSALYFNFVQNVQTEAMGPHSARLSYEGVPAPIAQWSAFATGFYMAKCIDLGGATNARFQTESVKVIHTTSGVEVCRITLAFAWEAK